MSQELSARQKEIIDQSTVLIAENGIQNLTIKNLAKKMGFSEPAIYRHFSGKNEILLAIIGLFSEKSNQGMLAQKMKSGTFFENLKLLFLKHTQLFAVHPTYATVIFSEELFRNDSVLMAEIQKVMEGNSQRIEGLINSAKEQGELGQDIGSKSLAIIIMGSIRLVVKKWVLSGFRSDLDADVVLLYKTLLKLVKGDK